MSPTAPDLDSSSRTSGFQPPVRRPRLHRKFAGRFAFYSLIVLAMLTGSLSGLMLVYSADLPQIHDLEHYQPSTTTELYDIKGRVFGSFALERRVVVSYQDLSPTLRQAVISIEDKNFESHWGVNIFRVVIAAYHDLTSPNRAQGASTLTMQLARNLFLSSQRTFGRKFKEVYLSIQIERSFTKQQIFTLYANQIYLGHGMYGFEAGSEYYFSKHAKDLTLPEAALLAGLPKGPVAYSPILNPDKALHRRNLVINEMLQDHAITEDQAESAKASPLGLHLQQPASSLAPWFVEEVRRELEHRFGTEQVHEAGLRVYTTLDLDLQTVANRAVRDGLATYERRRGWQPKLMNVVMGGIDTDDYKHPDWATVPAKGDYVHGVVQGVKPEEVSIRIGEKEMILTPEDWLWTGYKTADLFLVKGDIVYVKLAAEQKGNTLKGSLEQDSGAEGSLMAMDNATGDVLAMVGGRDYALSQFNRATQAERQTGSSFKPYVYTAAVENGAKPDDKIVDSPTSFGTYTPRNYDGKYLGTISLLHAFADSRNIPAIKLAERVGINKVIEMVHRFGITSNIPAYLPIALGSVELTLQEQVASYSVFPNDGIRITPRFIRKVTNSDNIPILQEPPEINDAISSETARTMIVFLREVVAGGTAYAASALKHPLGGKTGTTNDFTDAWFVGFSPSVTCGVWVGNDSRQSLGEKETGARTALPIWMEFMRAAIAGHDDEVFPGDAQPKAKTEPVATPAQNKLASTQPAAAAKPVASKPAAAKPATPAAKPVTPKPVPSAPVAKQPATNLKPSDTIMVPEAKATEKSAVPKSKPESALPKTAGGSNKKPDEAMKPKN
jgi:penicillin-binding protein 1A